METSATMADSALRRRYTEGVGANATLSQPSLPRHHAANPGAGGVYKV